MLSYQLFDFFFWKHCENLDVSLCISIRSVDPVLIKFVRRSFFWVKPDISTFGFSEFCSICFRNQRASKCIGFSSCDTADKLRSSGDISPLVRPSHLQRKAFLLV